MSDELVPAPKSAAMIQYGAGGLSPASFDEAWRMAQLLSKSDLVPKDYKDKPENCLVAMQMGAEVGFKPMQSLQGIAVINGRPSIWGDALWALVQSCPVVEDAHESFDRATNTATCIIKRKGRSQPTVQTFSEVDAKKAGLWGKPGPWQTATNRMLQMRARAFAARDALPDVLKGLPVAEEVRDFVELPGETVETLPAPSPWTPELMQEASDQVRAGTYTAWWQKQSVEFRRAALQSHEHASFHAGHTNDPAK